MIFISNFHEIIHELKGHVIIPQEESSFKYKRWILQDYFEHRQKGRKASFSPRTKKHFMDVKRANWKSVGQFVGKQRDFPKYTEKREVYRYSLTVSLYSLDPVCSAGEHVEEEALREEEASPAADSISR